MIAWAPRVRGAARSLALRWQRMSPPAFFVGSFATLILIGALGFLLLPGLYHGPALGALDALFTSTSAVCVTGLIVVDTATRFTFWGQLWILALIQLGGIGLITLATSIIGALGRRLSLRSEMTSVALIQRDEDLPIWQLARRVARFTLLVEAAGAGLLFLVWLPRFPVIEALWHAAFHAVSAFCNAGFSTFTDSLESFADSPLTLVITSALIVIGGLGFLTIGELGRWRRADGHRRRRLSSHSYAVVATTAALLVAGAISYAMMEWDGVLGPFPVHHKLTNAWFMSVTARTAGFNSVPYGQLGNQAAFLTILLMFVGGSPGSTAGGLKTTTLAVLAALAWSRIRGRRFVELHGRSIPEGTIERTVSLTLLAFGVMTAAFFALNVASAGPGTVQAQHDAFLPLAFECTSAFATVGLSMGTTSVLTAGGKLVVIALMFLGRVGLLSFFSAVLLRRGRVGADYRRASEDLMVG